MLPRRNLCVPVVVSCCSNRAWVCLDASGSGSFITTPSGSASPSKGNAPANWHPAQYILRPQLLPAVFEPTARCVQRTIFPLSRLLASRLLVVLEKVGWG